MIQASKIIGTGLATTG